MIEIFLGLTSVRPCLKDVRSLIREIYLIEDSLSPGRENNLPTAVRF